MRARVYSNVPNTFAQSNSDMGSLQRYTFYPNHLEAGQWTGFNMLANIVACWSCEDSPNSTLNIWRFQFAIIDFEIEKLSHKFARFFSFKAQAMFTTYERWWIAVLVLFQIQDWVWRAHHTKCSNRENATLTNWFLRFLNGTERKNVGSVHQAWCLRWTDKFPTLKSSSANLSSSSVQ